MDDAVLKAYKAAGPNETVLLAPACASFDKYKSYKDRGEHFKRAVHRIASGLQ
jgi:UDP-N-acetylmuramoylalanine--D-glutamate ligase